MDQLTRAIVDEVGRERSRQLHREGWSRAHDDDHDNDQLAWAAACYAAPTPIYERHDVPGGDPYYTEAWPWNDGDRRDDHGRRRRLVIAAALIVAEIERLDRDVAIAGT